MTTKSYTKSERSFLSQPIIFFCRLFLFTPRIVVEDPTLVFICYTIWFPANCLFYSYKLKF